VIDKKLIAKMEIGNVEDVEIINYLVDKRDESIEDLICLLKINDEMTVEKSLEQLQHIFTINSQIKLQEDSLIIKRLKKTILGQEGKPQ
jgi:hypothetical protein